MELYQKLLICDIVLMFMGIAGLYLVVSVMESDLADPRKVLPRMIFGQLMILCGAVGFLGTITVAILRIVAVL